MLEARDGIKYLSSDVLSSAGGIAHGFLTRLGGVSSGPYGTLNFDGREGDIAENVAENSRRVSKAFGFSPGMLTTVNQVHGDRILVVSWGGPAYRKIDADSIATVSKGVPVGVLTADCLPILLYDPVKRAVSAVHAGWRGTSLGVAAKAVRSLAERFGSRPGDIMAAMGPHIGRCCYRVGENVLDEFKRSFGAGSPVLGSFIRGGDGSLVLDLALANEIQLIEAGLKGKNVSRAVECTSCRTDLFYSYRREGGRTGRALSFIMLEG